MVVIVVVVVLVVARNLDVVLTQQGFVKGERPLIQAQRHTARLAPPLPLRLRLRRALLTLLGILVLEGVAHRAQLHAGQQLAMHITRCLRWEYGEYGEY